MSNTCTPSRKKIMAVFGTRPEAIKMAPVVQALKAQPDYFETVVCVTAQHRDMLDQVLTLFKLQPDEDLNVMRPNQDLFQVTSAVLNGMRDVLEKHRPDCVLVHGDTTTSMAATLAAFYLKIPVGHVEAGLRTFDMHYPFPEEMNRVVTDSMSSFHFAPTQGAVNNLKRCGISSESITLTGNTVIDALFYTLKQPSQGLPVSLPDQQRMVLLTTHRRENFGAPLQDICAAILELIDSFQDICVVLPVHPNPNVKDTVEKAFHGNDRIHLIAPQEYEPFCRLMERATLILTDSGGVQEEAPSLKKPVLVLRDETERPEAVELGVVKLVGPHRERIVAEATELLRNPQAYAAMARVENPYGDGYSSARIIEVLKQKL